MKSYKSHKVVQAAKIIEVGGFLVGGVTLVLDGDDGSEVTRVVKDAAWSLKHEPQVGQYYVVYPDGYASVSPARAFEEGYTQVEDSAPGQHASAPDGWYCADCTLSREACPACYERSWRSRHPEFMPATHTQNVMANGLTEAETVATPSVAGLTPRPAHQDRVIGELAELTDRIEKLKKFIDDDERFESIDREEQWRMVAQLRAMIQYRVCLADRVKAFTKDVA